MNRSRLMLIASMAIFGTLAPFVRNIPVSSPELALYRAVLAAGLIGAFLLLTKQRIDLKCIRRELPLLLFSGIAMGFNWILLFESYNYTTVAVATLCYYLAPIFVIIASPFVLGEKLTAKKGLCVVAALLGMVLVSGVIQSGSAADFSLTGVAFGVGAGALYACIILMNKKLKDINSYDTTVMQLAAATIVLIPYCLLTVPVSSLSAGPAALGLLLFVGIVHTGIAYVLYFGSMKDLKAQTVAIFSYIDPILAVLLSAFLLRESMDMLSVIGAVLILGSTFVSEMLDKK